MRGGQKVKGHPLSWLFDEHFCLYMSFLLLCFLVVWNSFDVVVLLRYLCLNYYCFCDEAQTCFPTETFS